MSDQKFLGHIIKYDPITQILSIKCDFIDIDRQKILEQIQQDKSIFSFQFKKPYRREKTYPQLQKYFQLLKQILIKLDIYPDSDIISAFDKSIKESALSCKELIIYDKGIPIPPSKADMSIEEMDYLIKYLYETYKEVLDEEEINTY